MLSNTQEIKKFIEWCKTNKVKSFSNGDIAFELSELSFVKELTEPELREKTTQAYDETLVDTAKQELENEDEDLMFWSTQK